MSKQAAYYREKAERCRQLAKKAEDGTTRANLLDVARQYEKLAEEADAGK